MALKLDDMTQVLQETTRRGVGSRRWQKPVYMHFLPPCNHACPAGEDIQGWLALAQAGEYEKAWYALVANNPMPAIHGRACYHPCEGGCNRGELDSPVAIHSVERFLGDLAAEKGWQVSVAPATGKKVLVVGAGPAGLSCAWHLARMGHQVEIRDAAEQPGGMMMYGIPAYRLPRDPMNKDIARITGLPGVTLRCGQRVDDVVRARQEGGFDAVFVGVGAQLANRLNIPAMDGRKMTDAISLLGDVSRGGRPALGRVVAVVGGGNVAMDAARTARRLGATDTVIIFRYDQKHMEALPAEAAEAVAEGAKVRWLSVVDHFGADGLVVEKVTMNPDGSVTPTGETERLAADAVVLAVGQHSDLGLLADAAAVKVQKDGTVAVDADLMTGQAGIFAGGDCIGGARTMTTATGHGKLAARAIDAWLAGRTYEHPASHPLVSFDMLHLPDYRDAPRSVQAEQPVAERHDFAEVDAGLDERHARYEAQRCLSCGNCFECDNCYAACPEQAITRLGPGQGYAVSMDLCTGCATCFEQCPCHAIEMEPEAVGADTSPAPSAFKVRA
ncbi:NAD(P)-binding protein [Gluconacetobacter sp. Hr-1-5]|uniref:NAD(P)-binding protein n=1 Tax=Gluconacetobacter sp. Hr-1-5 TaxID=3395370 RepID=UPI003B52299C